MFLSSYSNDKIELTKEEYKQLIGDTVKPEYLTNLKVGNSGKRGEFLIEFGTDGHQYAHNPQIYFDAYVCFHYIDCIKCKKDTL